MKKVKKILLWFFLIVISIILGLYIFRNDLSLLIIKMEQSRKWDKTFSMLPLPEINDSLYKIMVSDFQQYSTDPYQYIINEFNDHDIIFLGENHRIKHGQAVIVGIIAALYLSKKLNLISSKALNSYLELVYYFTGRIKLNRVDIESILKIMESDKKNRRNQIRFVLIKDIGEIVTDISAERKLIKESISESIAHFS